MLSKPLRLIPDPLQFVEIKDARPRLPGYSIPAPVSSLPDSLYINPSVRSL
jgi:hypothetical protein